MIVNESLSATEGAETNVAGSSTGIGIATVTAASASGNSNLITAPLADVPVITAQTIFWSAAAENGTFQGASVAISGYKF